MAEKKLTYKLSASGEALLRAAKDDKQPQQGIIIRNGVRVDLKDPNADLSLLAGTQYVTEIKSSS